MLSVMFLLFNELSICFLVFSFSSGMRACICSSHKLLKSLTVIAKVGPACRLEAKSNSAVFFFQIELFVQASSLWVDFTQLKLTKACIYKLVQKIGASKENRQEQKSKPKLRFVGVSIKLF